MSSSHASNNLATQPTHQPTIEVIEILDDDLKRLQAEAEKKRQALLRHLGGLQGVARAGIDDLARVPGISQQLAARVHACFNE